MIKPIEEPISAINTERQMIINDLIDAYEHGMDEFEFTGYNSYKYLQSRASEQGKLLCKKIYRQKFGNESIMFRDVDLFPLFVVWSIKDEKQGRRVFCRIRRENIEKMGKLIGERERRSKGGAKNG